MRTSEYAWQQFGFQRAETLNLTSVCWITKDRVLAGTYDGKLLIVEYADLKCVYMATTVEEIIIPTKEE
jgi:hypothetical protein